MRRLGKPKRQEKPVTERKKARSKDLDSIAPALRWETDTAKAGRMLDALTPAERETVWRKCGEQVQEDRRKFRKIIESVPDPEEREKLLRLFGLGEYNS